MSSDAPPDASSDASSPAPASRPSSQEQPRTAALPPQHPKGRDLRGPHAAGPGRSRHARLSRPVARARLAAPRPRSVPVCTAATRDGGGGGGSARVAATGAVPEERLARTAAPVRSWWLACGAALAVWLLLAVVGEPELMSRPPPLSVRLTRRPRSALYRFWLWQSVTSGAGRGATRPRLPCHSHRVLPGLYMLDRSEVFLCALSTLALAAGVLYGLFIAVAAFWSLLGELGLRAGR